MLANDTEIMFFLHQHQRVDDLTQPQTGLYLITLHPAQFTRVLTTLFLFKLNISQVVIYRFCPHGALEPTDWFMDGNQAGFCFSIKFSLNYSCELLSKRRKKDVNDIRLKKRYFK